MDTTPAPAGIEISGKKKMRGIGFYFFLHIFPNGRGKYSPPRISARNRDRRDGGAACFLHVWSIPEAGAGLWMGQGCEVTGQRV